MELKQLHYFVTIAEEGTISAAAKKLYMSQPPLSQQLHLLEKELDCVLFERTSRHMILTPPGRLLFEKAKLILNMAAVTEDEIMSYDNTDNGTVRIGIVSSLTTSYIMNIISEFALEHPHVNLEIFESNTYQLLERLTAKTIHFGIVRTPFIQSRFIERPLQQSHLVAVGRKDIFNYKDDIISLHELTKQELIIYRRWENVIKEKFRLNGLVPDFRCITDDARTASLFAHKGIGVALLPESAVLAKDPELTICNIENNPWNTNIELLYDEKSYIPKCTKLLLDYIVNYDDNYKE